MCTLFLLCVAMSFDFWNSLLIDLVDDDVLGIRLEPNSRAVVARILVVNEFSSLDLVQFATHPSKWDGAEEMLPQELEFVSRLRELRLNFKLTFDAT